MKKNQLYALTLLFAILSLGFSSCSKEKSDNNDDNGDYYVKFKINGGQQEFKANMFAIFSQMDMAGTTIYSASLQGGLTGSGTTTNLMAINIRDITPIVAIKDYSDDIVEPTIQGTLLYFNAAGETLSTLGVTTSADLKIRITELSNTLVTGTFSGKIQALGGSTASTITEGSFRIKR